MDLAKTARGIARRYHTNDPLQLCGALGIHVFYMHMEDIRGLFLHLKHRNLIYLDEDLEEHERRWVCAHELGHFFLHKKTNRIFMETRTFLKTSAYEHEADRFAVWLLYPEDHTLSDWTEYTTTQLAACMGVPEDVAKYRIERIEYPFNLSLY